MKMIIDLRIILLGILIILFFITNDRIQSNPRSVIWSDAEGYYSYLPGLFILPDYHHLQAGSMWPKYNAQGEFVNKYSCGVAYFELPFFLLGQWISKQKGINTNDFFYPVYSKAIAFGGLLISFLGLILLGKLLLRHFQQKTVFWVVPAVFLGTNLFHYTTKEMGISHVYSFFLFVALLYHLPAFFRKPGILNSVLLGIILGWIILIRPTNIIVSALLLGYDVYSWQDLKNRLLFFWTNKLVLLLAIVSAMIMFIPQLLYWKEMTGQWIYYSYTDEGFPYWNRPKIAAVLFDVQNGLLLYSPLVLLMLGGIVYGIMKRKYHGPVMAFVFLLATYIFASWWAWWFGGAFGHRSYVEYYALLAIPFAGLSAKLLHSHHRITKILYPSLLVVLMLYSVRLSYLYTSLPGPWDGADWRWNWEKYEWIMSHFFKIF